MGLPMDPGQHPSNTLVLAQISVRETVKSLERNKRKNEHKKRTKNYQNKTLAQKENSFLF